MGLFRRPSVATAAVKHSFVEVIQNEGNNTNRDIIAWRHPSTDFNTHSKLLVRQGEEAIFENGASEWQVFPECTECHLHTQNIAIIRNLQQALSGGQSWFPCRIYFISTEEFQVPWGTEVPIGYTCPLIGRGTLMRGFGEYTIKVSDSALFAKKLLRDGVSYTVQELKVKLFQRIYQEIAEVISDVLEKNQIVSMECSKKKKEISNLCKPGVQALLFDYGISLVDFTVNLVLDEEQRQMYEQSIRLQEMSAQGKDKARMIDAQSKMRELEKMGGVYTTIKGMDILQTLAENPAGGVASAGAGIGMGMAVGGMMSNITETVFPNKATQQQHAEAIQPDPVESLEKMKLMLEKGLISQDIYDRKVTEILSRL